MMGDMRKGSKMTLEQRQRLSDAHKGQIAWNKGIPWSNEIKKKLKKSHLGQIPWNKGIPWNEEARKKMSMAKLGKPSATSGKPRSSIRGKNHHNWKGGITSKNRLIRHSIEYKQWRLNVLRRDKWTCVSCGFRSTKSKAAGYSYCDIRVDHIKPFFLYPKLRFNVANGRTLCIPCDKESGWNYKRDYSMKSNKLQ